MRSTLQLRRVDLPVQTRPPRTSAPGRTCGAVRVDAKVQGQMKIYVPPHPLVKHWLAIARNEATPPSMFRGAVAELGRVLLYEMGREFLTMIETEVRTPLAPTTVSFVEPSKPVKLVPILRAGLALLDHASSVIPVNVTYHVGYKRNEETLQSSMYYNNLPAEFAPDDQIVVLDVLLATGGTIMSALEEISRRGASMANVRVVCAVAAPPALQKLSEQFPELQVYAGIIDAEVNEHGYIVPGLGDAGNRAFGTSCP